jgi:hypothetical protein
MLLLDLGMTVSFPTIVIPKLRDSVGPLVLNDEQISWFGKLLLAVLKFTFYLQKVQKCHSTTPTCLNAISFFVWRRAPQQKLRTHRSLEAYCATL